MSLTVFYWSLSIGNLVGFISFGMSVYEEGVSSRIIIFLPTDVWIVLFSSATWVQSVICACIGSFDLVLRFLNYSQLFGNIYLLSICITLFILGIPIGILLKRGEMKQNPRLVAIWMLYMILLTISVVLAVLVNILDVTQPWLAVCELILGLYFIVNVFSLFVVYLRWREIIRMKGVEEVSDDL
ncbi:unnamed protein product [Allacma fusca]|uniref:Uncharacterized protein n=1 Tax=Allacma fusca TaxID=39272 RepID=A0A8J2JGE5_9HEXA|nr:unnamed protein product [Allacma fusca]